MPTRVEPPFRLYARAWCHLCEDMARQLRDRGVAFDEIDVDADPELERRYGELIPFLARADGSEICRYFLDEVALRAALGG